MALPIWGYYCTTKGAKLNLVTFDRHTDTHPPFISYLSKYEVDDSYNKMGKDIFKIPEVKHLLNHYSCFANSFSFDDVYDLSNSILANDEQILTACIFEYLDSYTIIHRNEAVGYENYDRLNGYNARYINEEHDWDLSVQNIHLPIALDFDLDFFRCRDDLNHHFFQSIISLVKNATVITIAREPKYFEKGKTDSSFTIREAEGILIDGLKKILMN